jgi:hypothetical protein
VLFLGTCLAHIFLYQLKPVTAYLLGQGAGWRRVSMEFWAALILVALVLFSGMLRIPPASLLFSGADTRPRFEERAGQAPGGGAGQAAREDGLGPHAK